ncbi:MAG: transposase [Opitutaceae bacterium]
MGAKFVNVDRDTALLLPPDMREWVPEDHLVHFLLEAVEHIDVGAARVNERGTGSDQYPPSLLLVYSYASGMFSSRQIERATYDSVAVRVLCADTHPDHDTLCAFRRQNAPLLATAFAQVLELAAHGGVLKVAGITVAIDGTKVLANASKHAATSYARAGETMRQLDLEVAELLAKAEQADATPLQDGLTIEGEVARRQTRKAKLAQARAAIEARAYARAMAAQAARAPDQPGPPPPAPPAPKEQINFTDADSAIMKAGSGQHFEQSYNAQGALEVDSRLFVAARVTRAPNDKEQLPPTLAAVATAAPVIQSIAAVLIDSGFVSEAAVSAVETDAHGQPTGVRVLAATGRSRHGRTVADLEKRADPPAPPPEATFTARLAHRTATRAGRERYKLRQQTIEPAFGIIKAALGFRRFSLRGLANVSLEWTLVTLAYNLKRLHTLRAPLQPA